MREAIRQSVAALIAHGASEASWFPLNGDVELPPDRIRGIDLDGGNVRAALALRPTSAFLVGLQPFQFPLLPASGS
jgi:hypothetical protein